MLVANRAILGRGKELANQRCKDKYIDWNEVNDPGKDRGWFGERWQWHAFRRSIADKTGTVYLFRVPILINVDFFVFQGEREQSMREQRLHGIEWLVKRRRIGALRSMGIADTHPAEPCHFCSYCLRKGRVQLCRRMLVALL